MTTLSGKTAIVGVAESDQIGKVPDKPAIALHAEAALNALEEAGLTLRDVDGLLTAGISPLELGEYLGIEPSYTDGTAVGGSSFVIHLAHAAAAIVTGRCSVALITHGESGRSRVGMPPRVPAPDSLRGQFEDPYGLPTPVGAYALACSRHMAEYGTTKEQLAEIAVATRKWAMLNPKAYMRDPITIEDVLNSRPIVWPFNLLDCCLVTDAGGACVVTSIERARDLKQKPALVHSVAQASGPNPVHLANYNTPDMQTTAVPCAEQLWRRSELKPQDMDCAQIYDAFTPLVIMGLEDYGFCKRGEGGPFTEGGRIELGGELPLLTSGGGLSEAYVHGFNLILEAVRQIRGTSTAQVEGCKNVLVTGASGVATSAMVLRGE